MGNQADKNKEVSDEIDHKLKVVEEKDMKDIHGLLLLGNGESGKTTIMKQLRHIWGKTYLVEERQEHRNVIYQNIIESIQILVKESKKLEKQYNTQIDAKNEENANYILQFDNTYFTDSSKYFTEEMYNIIDPLWKDPGIQKTYTYRYQLYYLLDSASYFLENMKRCIGEDYAPTFEDFSRSRLRTFSRVHQDFMVDNIKFRIHDVGGQKNERRKWLSHFNDVIAIIYVCALSGYNQISWEDPSINLLHEAWDVYEQYINYKEFLSKNIILFLNKEDLFDEMIQHTPFTKCVSEFPIENEQNKKEIIKYIIQEFSSRTENINNKYRQLYAHVTCGINTELVRKVFLDCKNIIVRKYLTESAMM